MSKPAKTKVSLQPMRKRVVEADVPAFGSIVAADGWLYGLDAAGRVWRFHPEHEEVPAAQLDFPDYEMDREVVPARWELLCRG